MQNDYAPTLPKCVRLSMSGPPLVNPALQDLQAAHCSPAENFVVQQSTSAGSTKQHIAHTTKLTLKLYITAEKSTAAHCTV